MKVTQFFILKKGFNHIPLLKFTIHGAFGKEANDFHNEIYFVWDLVVTSCAFQGAVFPFVRFLATACGEILPKKVLHPLSFF